MSSIRRRSRYVAAVVSILATGCGSTTDSSRGSETTSADDAVTADTSVADTVSIDNAASDPNEAAPGTGWTVLVYSIADTDLEPFMMDDLVQLSTVGSTDEVSFVALVDRAVDYSADPLLNLPDWSGGKLMQVDRDAMVVTEELGDIDTGDPELLASFIARGIAEHPAAHYALVLSDHGASWPGVGGDESSDHDSLSVAELRDGIGAGLEEAGVERLDLLGFDACLMATYEVASAMAPYADRLVASQELEPGHGWDYSSFSVLTEDPSASVDALGAAIIEGFAAEAEASGTSESITLSMIDLTRMSEVDEALAEFTGQLVEAAAQVAPVVGKNRATSLGFGSSPDPTEDTHMTDLALLASEIGVDALYVSDAADSLVRAIGDVVLGSVAGSAMNGATGLSIYFPPTADLYDTAYGDLPIGSGWAEFLAAYYGAGDAIPTGAFPTFLNPDGSADIGFDDDGIIISGAYDAAAAENLSEAFLSFGTIDADGTITYLGDQSASILDDGTAAGFYDLTTLVIRDGEDAATAYLTLVDDGTSETYTIDVPMAYYAPDAADDEYQDVLLTLTVEAATGDIVDETYYVYDELLETYGELTADPAGVIVPEVYVEGADGVGEWVPTSDTGLYADLPSLEYDFVALDPGTSVYIDLTIVDFGGNSDTVAAVVEVP